MTKRFRPLSTAAKAVMIGSLMLGVTASPAFAKKEKEKPAQAADTQGKLSPSKEYIAVYKELVAANAAKDAVALQAAIAKGEALATKPDDRYLQASFGLQLGLLNKDTKLQASSLDAMIDSGLAPAAEVAKFNYFSGSFAYNDKDYAKTIKRLETAKAGGSKEPALGALLADSYVQTGQIDQALTTSKAAIVAARVAGTRPMEDLYVRPAQALLKAGRIDELMELLAMRLQDYPAPEVWRNTLYIHLQQAAADKELGLDIFRLMRATKALNTRAEYLEYAANATEAGLPGEVVALITEGQTKGVIPKGDARFNEILSTQTTRTSGERNALLADVGKATSLPDSKRARSSGDALLGYGEYAGAATLYAAALNLPGAQPDLVNFRLGQAQAMAGNADGATQAFAKVTGPRKRLADLWLVHMKQMQAPAAAPAAAPAT